METDPTRRFSQRVEDYIRYRPSYPPEVIALLGRECGLRHGASVADGSLIGMGSTLLNAVVIGEHSIVGSASDPDAFRGCCRALWG